VGVFALAGVAAGHLVQPAPAVAREVVVEQQLACPQCTSTRLDVCDRPICVDMRTDIDRRLAAGQSAASIVSVYRSVYGDRVLADPVGGWPVVVPWVGVIGGLTLLAVAGWRLRRSEQELTRR
jgi:cytochrome c-type biogenesis protein CcmH/NrfF